MRDVRRAQAHATQCGRPTISQPSRRHQASVASAVLFAGFSAAHLIDDFVFDVPAEFHLGVQFTMFLALAYMLALVGLVAAAAQRSPAGHLGLIIAGILITLAQVLKSFPEILRPGPWHGGVLSELLAVGLAVFASLSAFTSSRCLILSRRRAATPP